MIGLSSSLRTHAKVTTPSVGGWNTNMGIIKDPPKSIHTRRIDKVSDTQQVTKMIADSAESRLCENIKTYARGVDPFGGGYISNRGGGGNYAGLTSDNPPGCSTSNPKLPYRVMREGAFRPPILTQEDLLPLSRMPRKATSAKTNIDFRNFTTRLFDYSKKRREGDRTLLKGSIRPTVSYMIKNPPVINRRVKRVEENPVLRFGYVGTNKSDPRVSGYINNEMRDQRGNCIRETTANIPVNTNISMSLGYQNPTVNDYSALKNATRDNNLSKHSVISAVSGPLKTEFIHKPIVRERNIPTHSITTNMVQGNICPDPYVSGTRTFKLPPKKQLGSFHSVGSIPQTQRPHLTRKLKRKTLIHNKFGNRLNSY